MIAFLSSLLFGQPKHQTPDPEQSHETKPNPTFLITRKFEMSVESYSKLIMDSPMSPVEWAIAKLEGTRTEEVQRIEDARRFLTREHIFKLVDDGKKDEIKRAMQLVIALGRFDKANAQYYMQPVYKKSPHGMWWVDKERFKEERAKHAGLPTAFHPEQKPSINKRYMIIYNEIAEGIEKLELEGILRPGPPMTC